MKISKLFGVGLVVIMVSIMGCDDNEDSEATYIVPGPDTVTGSWSGWINMRGGDSYQLRITLQQNGETVSGDWMSATVAGANHSATLDGTYDQINGILTLTKRWMSRVGRVGQDGLPVWTNEEQSRTIVFKFPSPFNIEAVEGLYSSTSSQAESSISLTKQ